MVVLLGMCQHMLVLIPRAQDVTTSPADPNFIFFAHGAAAFHGNFPRRELSDVGALRQRNHRETAVGIKVFAQLLGAARMRSCDPHEAVTCCAQF